MESDKRQMQPADPINSGSRWPAWLRILTSVVLAVHFGLIALTYFSNNSLHRMPFADKLLEKCQPYLIAMGWYTELLPMSLIGTETYDKPIEIEYKVDRTSRTWTSWIESKSSQGRWKRLGQLIGALALNEDEEGLGQIALSMVRKARSQGLEFEQVRFTSSETGTSPKVLLFQATIIELENGDLTLVPELEQTRTVPVTRGVSP